MVLSGSDRPWNALAICAVDKMWACASSSKEQYNPLAVDRAQAAARVKRTAAGNPDASMLAPAIS
eukprot:6292476-Pyramimonas_sp.AAC.1